MPDPVLPKIESLNLQFATTVMPRRPNHTRHLFIFGYQGAEYRAVETERHIALIEELKVKLARVLFPLSFWALMQMCSPSELQDLVFRIRSDLIEFDKFAELLKNMANLWIQANSLCTIDLGSSYSNSDRFHMGMSIDQVSIRDGYQCALTGTKTVFRVAHIVPDFAALDQCWPGFSDYLCTQVTGHSKNIFKRGKHYSRWNRGIFQCNMICLRSDLHDAWCKGLFALRPVLEALDKTWITVEFHWLPRNSQDESGVTDLTVPPRLTKDVIWVDGFSAGILDGPGYMRPIKTGDRFTLRTKNKNTYFLPNFKLLHAQWIMRRMAAMINSTETFPETKYDEEDNYGDRYGDDYSGDSESDREMSDDDPNVNQQLQPFTFYTLSDDMLPDIQLGA